MIDPISVSIVSTFVRINYLSLQNNGTDVN